MAFDTVQIITVFPEFGSFEEVVSLGGSDFVLRFDWREKLFGWFCSVYDDNRDPVFTNRRVQPGVDMARGVLDFPGGLYVTGSDDTKESLGKQLHVFYVE